MHRSKHIDTYIDTGRRGEGRKEGAPFPEILLWPNTVSKWSDVNNVLL